MDPDIMSNVTQSPGEDGFALVQVARPHIGGDVKDLRPPPPWWRLSRHGDADAPDVDGICGNNIVGIEVLKLKAPYIIGQRLQAGPDALVSVERVGRKSGTRRRRRDAVHIGIVIPAIAYR